MTAGNDWLFKKPTFPKRQNFSSPDLNCCWIFFWVFMAVSASIFFLLERSPASLESERQQRQWCPHFCIFSKVDLSAWDAISSLFHLSKCDLERLPTQLIVLSLFSELCWHAVCMSHLWGLCYLCVHGLRASFQAPRAWSLLGADVSTQEKLSIFARLGGTILWEGNRTDTWSSYRQP